jgi:hypothetical protein
MHIEQFVLILQYASDAISNDSRDQVLHYIIHVPTSPHDARPEILGRSS